MKLEDAEGWYARVYATIPLKKELTKENYFPLDLGCVTLDSEKGDIIWLDTYETNWIVEDNKLEFYCKLEIFSEDLQDEDVEFNFKVEDLENCTAEFYCGADMGYEDVFDMENSEVLCKVFMKGGFTPTHIIKCELE